MCKPHGVRSRGLCAGPTGPVVNTPLIVAIFVNINNTLFDLQLLWGRQVHLLIQPSMQPGSNICKSQLLTLLTHVCTHSSARFYRQCKRRSITTKFTKRHNFRDRLVKMTNFWSCMNYLQEKATQKANGILPKAGTFLSSFKIVKL